MQGEDRMKKKTPEPAAPVERHDTIRRKIVALLLEREHSAKDLSIELRVPEKEIYDHLEHIRKTVNKGESELTVTPAACEKCGFVFKKRERLKKPGKCPFCRGELIREPIFRINGLK
jgi:predicted Zn-ribbon and HTH transcriptional regulator